MDYIQVSFIIEPKEPGTEIIIAELSLLNFESFEETEQGVKAFILEDQFIEPDIKELEQRLSDVFTISSSFEIIKFTNWNAVWESNYEPVLIKDSVYIYAPFHSQKKDVKFSILIEPKMSFGTAHHETTSLVIEMMLGLDFRNQGVLDMGCGTGVLAILAEKMGASKLVAIDNDSNAFENAVENVKNNNCSHINVQLGGAEQIKNNYDCIIANINKNILLADMDKYSGHLNHKGSIIFSGFYSNDLEDIEAQANICGLTLDRFLEKNRWVAAKFDKQ